MMITPDTDGINHINVYSKGRTQLGRLLSNFAHTPFVADPQDGEFASVEAYWYWLKTGCKWDELKPLYGYNAKAIGKTFPRVEMAEFDGKNVFDELIKEAIRCKLRQNHDLRRLLKDSTLPLEHYYAYGSEGNWKVIPLPQYQWMIDEISRCRDLLQRK